ncbi:MAG TPA: hypothetical protein GXX75_13575 [Clostridiales bacterium]|nr:hypothetical protein [Clostridiales bacterium]
MPIPFLLAGLGAAAGLIGIGGHMSAKETNEKAQSLASDARDLYNSSKTSLERAQNNTEKALLKFGYSKKKILDCSMKQFLKSYEKIKSIEVANSVGLDEISNFIIDQEDAIQIREMSDIYSATISSGATGAAAGAVIALAASGSLPVITGGLSLAGSALAAGEIGAAAGIAGSALSFGAAMTPLAAVAAPVVLFTGISASIKADENLEKAQTMYAEAEAASEKMQVSETLCRAIAERSDMFNGVLIELDGMFSECVGMLDAVINKKSGFFGKKTIKSNDLSEEELKLIAVTRSLAGAVKAIIDTPILSKNGNISAKSKDIYNQTTYKLPAFTEAVKEIESYDYKVKPKEIKQSKANVSSKNNTKSGTPDTIRNVFAIALGLLASIIFLDTFRMGALVFATITLLIMKSDTDSKFFKMVKHIACLLFGIEFGVLFYRYCQYLTSINHFILLDIVVGFVLLILFGVTIPSKGKKVGNIRKMCARFLGCFFFLAVALLLFTFLNGLLGFSFKVAMIIVEILYIPFAIISVYMADE